jgi:hypothetical protein
MDQFAGMLALVPAERFGRLQRDNSINTRLAVAKFLRR